MSRTRQFSELRADAYKLSDLESFTDRYPASEVGRYVNQGISELWDLLVSSKGYAYYGKAYYSTPSLTGTGTTPPAVTVAGVPKIGTATAFDFHVDIVTGGTLGTMTFRYSTNNGTSYGSTILSSTSGIHYLSDVGLTVTFASGTYNADNVYAGSAQSKPRTTRGAMTYALPTDFYKTHRIWLTDASSSVIELEKVAANDESALLESDNSVPRYWQERDGYVDLLPTPDGTYTINLNYVPVAPILYADSDLFDGLNGFEEYPVCFAAYEMLLKEGDIEMANMVMQKMNKMQSRIKTMTAERDQSTPQRVQDVRGALAWKTSYRRRLLQ